jgi:hypothetical protein
MRKKKNFSFMRNKKIQKKKKSKLGKAGPEGHIRGGRRKGGGPHCGAAATASAPSKKPRRAGGVDVLAVPLAGHKVSGASDRSTTSGSERERGEILEKAHAGLLLGQRERGDDARWIGAPIVQKGHEGKEPRVLFEVGATRSRIQKGGKANDGIHVAKLETAVHRHHKAGDGGVDVDHAERRLDAGRARLVLGAQKIANRRQNRTDGGPIPEQALLPRVGHADRDRVVPAAEANPLVLGAVQRLDGPHRRRQERLLFLDLLAVSVVALFSNLVAVVVLVTVLDLALWGGTRVSQSSDDQVRFEHLFFYLKNESKKKKNENIL